MLLLQLLLLLPLLTAGCPSLCSCQLHRVDCSRRGLTQMPKLLPAGARSLDLSGNDIEIVNATIFEYSNEFISIDFSDNRINYIDPLLFKHLNLSFLNLRKNRLTSIPQKLRVHDRIDLASNALTSLSKEEVELLAAIRVVDLSRNRIVNIATASPKFSVVHTLDLAANAIRHLPEDVFAAFPQLTSLRLTRNRINAISRGSFNSLGKLETLDLSRNHLRSLSALTFEVMPSLKSLSLGRNRISDLDDGVFFGCHSLRHLNLTANRIEDVADGWLFGLMNLNTLDLSENQITSIEPTVWSHSPELTWLSLHGNLLSSLPSGAFRLLPRLEHLDLFGNRLTSLHKTAMTGLDQLRTLDLSSNQLAVCVEDGAVLHNTSLPYLRELRFSNNGLRVVPGRAFARFPGLLVLDLRENPIATMLPGAFEPLRLQSLFLSTNSVLCDCHMNWFASWLFSAGVDRSDVTATCAHPPPLLSIPVVNIDAANLTCEDDSPRARIALHPSSQVVIDGHDATLHCHGYGFKPLEVEWRVIEDGKPRALESDSMTSIFMRAVDVFNNTYTGHVRIESTLELREVTMADSLSYQCVVSNQYAKEYSIRAELQVHKAPTFIKEPDDVSLLVGQNAKISCSATGQPPPVIHWAKDGGKAFPAATERRLHVRQGDDHLYVLNVSLADQGVYTCQAMNSVGAVQASATVRVFANGFRSPLIDVETSVGETIVLDCHADVASSHLSIVWRKDGTILRNEGRIMLKVHDQILLIPKATTQDSGVYDCELWAGDDRLDRQVANVTVLSTSSLEAPEQKNSMVLWWPIGLLTTIIGSFAIWFFVYLLVLFRHHHLQSRTV